MKNILGTTDDLELFHKDGDMAYQYNKDSDSFSQEYTYDEMGNMLTYGDSDSYWEEYTYDEKGNRLTYKSSNGYSWERTYDENGNELTYKDGDGAMRGFDIPEYTMEELKEMIGKEFKIKL